MTDDPVMLAVVTANVELPPRRVCEGFKQEAWLAVFMFDKLSPEQQAVYELTKED